MPADPARKALERLREGNARFVAGASHRPPGGGGRSPAELAEQQQPHAVVLGCSDSRVPPEFVFDQGLGELFVVRAGGNVAGPTQVGSVEFAATQFGTRLVVVLGHTRCGAIEATLEHVRGGTTIPSPDLRSIVDLLRPSVEPLLGPGAAGDPQELVRRATRANVARGADRLRRSETLRRLIEGDGLVVVGAEYAVETGRVEFLDDV